MRKLAFYGILVGSLAWLPMAAIAEQPCETSVLFIGNSFTYYNDLPSMLSGLAKTGGQKTLVTDKETPGGCTLKRHWDEGKSLTAIKSRKWDFVVLQEHSKGAFEAKSEMFEYARKLNEAITNQGAKTLLYLTWSSPTPVDQPKITAAYQELGKELQATVIPVGIAWNAMVREHPEINLFSKDNHHPSPAGSYLAACAFYATLYGVSPVGLPAKASGLSDADARVLQEQALAAVQARVGK